MKVTLTLNQILGRLRALALSHKQINTFYFGSPVDRLAGADIAYPACFIDVLTGNISADSKSMTYEFDILLADLENVSTDAKSNELDLYNDLTLIAMDLKAMVSFSGYADDWEIGEGAAIVFMREKLEDIVCAVSMQLSISAFFDNNRCDVPAGDIDFENNQMSTIVNNYVYKGVGTEGSTLHIGALQNQTILLLLKGNAPLERISTDDYGTEITPEQYMFDAQNSVFYFGNDIEPLQLIQILHR